MFLLVVFNVCFLIACLLSWLFPSTCLFFFHHRMVESASGGVGPCRLLHTCEQAVQGRIRGGVRLTSVGAGPWMV